MSTLGLLTILRVKVGLLFGPVFLLFYDVLNKKRIILSGAEVTSSCMFLDVSASCSFTNTEESFRSFTSYFIGQDPK